MFKKLIPLLICAINIFADKNPIKIVTTFSILGDLVTRVGGDKVVISIVGPNSDAHLYEPKPKDVVEIAQADLVVINGLGFEGWIDRLIEASGYKGEVVVATQGINPRYSSSGDVDPHAWHDVVHTLQYIYTISEALCRIDPNNTLFYRNNAQKWEKDLMDLHHWIEKELDGIPQAKRRVITSHDAFGYFGDRYKIRFIAPVGMNTAAEPTVQAIAGLVDLIKQEDIKTIFVENISNPKIIENIAEITGASVGPVIYSDALSNPGQPGENYISLVRHNVTLFKKAMTE